MATPEIEMTAAVQGVKEASRKLNRLAGPGARRATKKAMRAAAKPVAAAVRRAAPKRKTKRPAKIKAKPLRQQVVARAPKKLDASEAAAMVVRVKARHAYLVEFGTKERKRLGKIQRKVLGAKIRRKLANSLRGGGRTGRMPASNFARQAAEATEGQAVAIFAATVGKEIQKEAAKG